eukprot:CAMPEP_0116877030 /NCGR_PEP_ID=MMETSP0463-20121206/8868_1 /TAXON_ID=181622 /ORGANISM="Strombidinopsis sp, Strain SopsisLIS2011" /LENGTH=127 /DNA_ID=CAMNT_0004524019 /DNA_START=17 /DNA_END=400 /DNA_ORIENTATION=-
MPPKAQKKILFPIESVEQFQEIGNGEINKKLAIIDLHLDWCGPASCMDQNYRALYFSFDTPENRIEFWSCNEQFIPEDVKENFKHGPLTCKPRFLIYSEGEIKEEVDGADYTKLVTSANKYIPHLDE